MEKKKMSKLFRVVSGKNKYAWFALTSRCNCKCITCNIWKKNESIPLQDAFNVLDALYKNGFGFVQFTGGEPTLYPRLCDLIEYASRYNMFTSIPSNGTTLTDTLASKLKSSKLDIFSVSIDHYDKKICEKIRNHKNIFKKILKTIDLLKKHRIYISSSTNLTRYNFQDIGAIIEYITGELQIPFGLCYPDIITESTYKLGGDTESVSFSDEELYSTFSLILKYKKRGYPVYNTYAYIEDVLRFLKNKTTYRCTAGRDTIYIDWNGDIYPCFHKSCVGNYKNFKFNYTPDDCNRCMLECFREPGIFLGSLRGKISLLRDIDMLNILKH